MTWVDVVNATPLFVFLVGLVLLWWWERRGN